MENEHLNPHKVCFNESCCGNEDVYDDFTEEEIAEMLKAAQEIYNSYEYDLQADIDKFIAKEKEKREIEKEMAEDEKRWKEDIDC